MTLEQLQAQREEILKQMAAPEQVRFGERMVGNRPYADLEAALRRTDREIASQQNAQPRQIVITPSGT